MVSMNLNNALLIILGIAGLGVSIPFLSALFWASAIVYGFTGKFGNPKSRMVGYATLLADIFFIAAIGFGIFNWTIIGDATLLADIFFIIAIAWTSSMLDDNLESWHWSMEEEEIE
jgi:hypothetical protein